MDHALVGVYESLSLEDCAAEPAESNAQLTAGGRPLIFPDEILLDIISGIHPEHDSATSDPSAWIERNADLASLATVSCQFRRISTDVLYGEIRVC